MKLTISYRAEYRYERRVSLSPHIVRLFPRDAWQARVLNLDFSTNATGAVHWRHDLFDNVVAQCFYPGEDDRLVYRLDAEVAVEERNPFGFLLDSRALQWPVDYTPREREVLGVFMIPEKADLPTPLRPLSGSETVNALVTMNQWVHTHIAYERREEGAAHPPDETLRLRRGACRDTAVLLAAALRAQGFAARLVSGFLWESASDPRDRKADSALHAWTEVFLPGAGWVGLDPANGVLADHHYLATAVGREPVDIEPVSGLYFGDSTVPHRLETKVEIAREK
ncbi:MAG: transglutaminase family protein [Chthoniobacterales bacterium]|jgi:transglutaminase-like putative cysteine protease